MTIFPRFLFRGLKINDQKEFGLKFEAIFNDKNSVI